MDDEKTAIYGKMRKDIRDKASQYVTQSKIINSDIKTFIQLIECSIEEYLDNHKL